MKLGEKIKKLRISNKMTMQDLADKANLSKGYISMLESGKNPNSKKEIVPSLDTVQKISNAFNISLENFLTDVQDNISIETSNSVEEKQNIDLQTLIDNVMSGLDSNSALMYKGEPVDDLTRELVRGSVEQAAKIALSRYKDKHNEGNL